METTNKITLSTFTRVGLFIASILLFTSIFIPIWRIELDAPQYPEGLTLQIFANKLGGQVDIINGLNHYIGMKTLHAEEFIEFTILPYIIGFFALFLILTVYLNKKKLLNVLCLSFILFGIIAMVDFWRWEYNYGHNLDPNAAIIVPGMAYQPPLIGFKQLLNFGAYSVPDIGGWFFIISGLIMVAGVIKENGIFAKKEIGSSRSVAASFLLLCSCAGSEPEPIRLNKDNCEYCKMTISDGRYGAEIITKKGRIYKFDDVACLLNYKKDNASIDIEKNYICDYSANNKLVLADDAYFIVSENFKSPMGGGVASFSILDSAKVYAAKFSLKPKSWSEIAK